MGEYKEDMSGTCGFGYEERWLAANLHLTMGQDEWNKWYSEHCGKCKYMCEICIFVYREKNNGNSK